MDTWSEGERTREQEMKNIYMYIHVYAYIDTYMYTNIYVCIYIHL